MFNHIKKVANDSFLNDLNNQSYHLLKENFPSLMEEIKETRKKYICDNLIFSFLFLCLTIQFFLFMNSGILKYFIIGSFSWILIECLFSVFLHIKYYHSKKYHKIYEIELGVREGKISFKEEK